MAAVLWSCVSDTADPQDENEITVEIHSPMHGSMYMHSADTAILIDVSAVATVDLHSIAIDVKSAAGDLIYEHHGHGDGTEPLRHMHFIPVSNFTAGGYTLSVATCGDHDCAVHAEGTSVFTVQ